MSSGEESMNSDIIILDDENQSNSIEVSGNIEEQTEEIERTEREANEDNQERDEDGEKQIVKPKRVIRIPQPKLNDERLKGPRGLTAIQSYFERVKFKGKGYECEDLNVIMKTYEYWCHRLFPKFPFDTCIQRLEKLGSKRATQAHIKKIRYNLLVEDRPVLNDSDEENNVDGFVDIQNSHVNNQNQDDHFNQFLGPSSSAVNTATELTEKQMERIRLNKERAEKLKQERLRKIREKAEEILDVSSQLPSTSGWKVKANLLNENENAKVLSEEQNMEISISDFVDIQNNPISQQQNVIDHVYQKSLSLPVDTETELTEKQLNKMTENKRRAEQIRLKRLKKIRGSAEEITSQLPSTSGLLLSKNCQNERGNAPKSINDNLIMSDIEQNEGNLEDIDDILNDIVEDKDAFYNHENTEKEKKGSRTDLPQKDFKKIITVLDNKNSVDADLIANKEPVGADSVRIISNVILNTFDERTIGNECDFLEINSDRKNNQNKDDKLGANQKESRNEASGRYRDG